MFLSYASQDAQAADRICAALRAGGVEVWLDQSELRGGDAWDQKIQHQIRDCALFVAIVSRHTDERAEGYFRLEWKLAVDRSHRMADDEPFLLPVVVDDVRQATARVPERFRQVQWTSLSGGEAPNEFVRHVAALLAHDRSAAASISPEPRASAATRLRSRRQLALLVVAAAAVSAAAGYLAIRRPAATTPEPAGARVAAATSAGPSVAVLPFVDMSEKKDQEYFADGLSEELIDLLTKVQGLHVPARTSSFYFKGKQATLAEIARALVVEHVLEGSVRKSGRLLRVTAQLVRVDSGYHVWSETFDRPLDDVFKVQDEIAARVVAALRVTLVSGVPPRAAPTRSNEAYALYLQARALARSAGEGDAAAAQQTLRRALALDPQFATAWAELAHSYTAEFGWHDGIDHASACAQAHEAADRALALAPALADAHRAKAIVLTECQGSPAAAEAELKQALALDPGDAAVWHAYAAHANSQGRFAEGLRLAQESIARDPLNAWNYYPLAIAQSNLGRPAEAEATYRRMVEIAPTAAGVHALHANSLLGVNRPGEALAEAERESDEQFRDMDLPLIYDALGRRAEAERAIDEFIRKYGQRDTFTPAEFYACRHDADRALPWLRRAYGDGIAPDADLPNRMACLQGIEHDPRYQELVRRAPPKIHFP